MEAVAHSPAFAKKVGIPQSVGKDFSNADKGRKFQKGGDMKAKMSMKKFEKSSKDMMADKAMMGYKKGGAVRGEGIAKRGFADGGKVQTVQVRGVGAARARTAKIC